MVNIVNLEFTKISAFLQKTDELQAALLQEREARVQLESQLQQFTDRLSPLMISPAP